MAYSKALFSEDDDGQPVDEWIFDELLGDDPSDDEYRHDFGKSQELSEQFVLDWNKEDHPVDENGKFVEGGESGEIKGDDGRFYVAKLALMLAGEWDEGQHPRGEDGKFVSSGDRGQAALKDSAQGMVKELAGEDPQPISSDNFSTADGWNYTRAAENKVQSKSAKDLAERSGLYEGEVKSWMRAWANGKPVDASTWSTLQASIQAEFGLKDAPTTHLGRKLKESSDARKFVRAQYESTQEELKSRGITEVTVYRGQPKIEGEDVVLQPGSSWSLDRNLASNFAVVSHGENGRVLTATVPASRILALPTNGGCLQQAELVLLGGPLKVEQSNAR